MKISKIVLGLVAVVIVGVGLWWVSGGGARSAPPPGITPVACTMEAKICPDGSAVGRSGPKCEFTTCPSEALCEGGKCPNVATSEITLGVGEKGKVGDVSIILNAVTQDSRCPADVQCIWAGAVSLNVTLSDTLHSETVDISSAETPRIFGENEISIVSIVPPSRSKKEILKSEYKITFHVEKITTKNEATVKGTITLSPTCPVERIPPDPNCAPKPYQTAIQVFLADGTELVKTLQSQSDGSFSLVIPFGNYTIFAGAGKMLPSCAPITLSVKTANPSPINIICDTGIR